MKCPKCGNTTYFSLEQPSELYANGCFICEECQARFDDHGLIRPIERKPYKEKDQWDQFLDWLREENKINEE